MLLLESKSPHILNVSLLKFPEIVSKQTSLCLYDHFYEKTSTNLLVPITSSRPIIVWRINILSGG